MNNKHHQLDALYQYIFPDPEEVKLQQQLDEMDYELSTDEELDDDSSHQDSIFIQANQRFGALLPLKQVNQDDHSHLHLFRDISLQQLGKQIETHRDLDRDSSAQGLTRDEWLLMLNYDPTLPCESTGNAMIELKRPEEYTVEEKLLHAQWRQKSRVRQRQMRRVLRRMHQHQLTLKHLSPLFPPYDWSEVLAERRQEELELKQKNEVSEESLQQFLQSERVNKQQQHPEVTTGDNQLVVMDVGVNSRLNQDSTTACHFKLHSVTCPDGMIQWRIIVEESYNEYMKRITKEDYPEHLCAHVKECYDAFTVQGVVEDNALTRMLITKLTIPATEEAHTLWCNHDSMFSHRIDAFQHLWQLSHKQSINGILLQQDVVHTQVAYDTTLKTEAEQLTQVVTWIDEMLKTNTGKRQLQTSFILYNHQVHNQDCHYRLDVIHSRYRAGKFFYWNIVCAGDLQSSHYPLKMVNEQDEYRNEDEEQSHSGGIDFVSPLTELMIRWLTFNNTELWNEIRHGCNEQDNNCISLYRQSILLHLVNLID